MARRQTIQHVQNGNIIVQVQGANNKVTVGRPHLELVPWGNRVRSSEGATEAQLLTPYVRFTDMVGRDNEMNDLRAWANSDKPLSIRLVTGRAGAGKTRMALELMDAVCRSKDCEWQAGFVTAREMQRFVGQQNLSGWGWQRNTLAVLDYAATAMEHLRTWFEELANNPGVDGRRLRILLLEREAGGDTGWWDRLMSISHSYSHARLADLVDPEPWPLSPLKTEDRRVLFQQMTARTAERLEKTQVPLLAAPGTSRQLDEQIAGEQYADPLYLMMAALTAADRDVTDVEALSLSRTDLAHSIGGREVQRLKKFGLERGGPEDAVALLGAISTLTRGIPPDVALAVVKEEVEANGYEWKGGPAALRDVMLDALPGADGGIGFVEPDIVGEAVVMGVLGGQPNLSQAGIVRRATQRAREPVVESVIHAIQDFSVEGVEGPMEWLETLITTGAAGDTALLFAVESAMPEHTAALRMSACEITQTLVDRFALLENKDEDMLNIEAMYLNNLSSRLADLGRLEDALEKAEQSVQIRERLSEQKPDYLPYLALSLNTMANRLSEIGRPLEAAEAAQKAVSVLEGIEAQNPGWFLYDLGTCSTNLASRFLAIGRLDNAVERAERAVTIFRELASKDQYRYLDDLAGSLNNLASVLDELGMEEDALEAIEEAVGLYEQLAQDRPDAFLHLLASSVSNLTQLLNEAGRHEEALSRMDYAVSVFECLATQQPEAFLPRLAAVVNNLANMLDLAGKHEEADEKAIRSTGIYEQLAETTDAFNVDYARSLGVRANCLSNLKRQNKAADCAAKALATIREPLQLNPHGVGSLASWILQGYLQITEQAKVEPDMELVTPVFEVLAALGLVEVWEEDAE